MALVVDKPQEVVAVATFCKRFRKIFELDIVDPPISPCDFLDATDFSAGSILDNTNKLAGILQASECSGVEPSRSAFQHRHGE